MTYSVRSTFGVGDTTRIIAISIGQTNRIGDTKHNS